MRSRRWLINLLIAAVIILVGLITFWLSQPPPDPPLPSPNAYEDFLKAGQMLAANTSDFDELSDEQLRKLVRQNEEALRLVRTGLSRECQVPKGLSQDYMNNHVTDLMDIKRVVHALVAEGRLAELEDRKDDAARVYWEAIRYGQEVMRGGTFIDGLVGIACESIGVSKLQTLLTNLSAKTCHEIIDASEAVQKKPESFEDVMKNEKEWARRSYPLYYRIVSSVMHLFKIFSTPPIEQRVLQKFQAQEIQRRNLLIDLATRAYELEKGQGPKNIEALVPGYLQVIPDSPLESQSP